MTELIASKGADDVARIEEQRAPTAPATEPTSQAGRPAYTVTVTADDIASLDEGPPLPVAIFRKAHLPRRVPAIIHPGGDRVVVTYDPDQVHLGKIRQYLHMVEECRETADSFPDAWADATPEQLHARDEINRIIDESDDPAGAAARALELFRQERGAKGSVHTCSALAGACEGSDCGPDRISNEPIHMTPLTAYRAPQAAPGHSVLGFQIVHFPENEPELSFDAGGDFLPLDLDGTDQVISDLAAHLDLMRKAREQLAALIAEHRGARAGWEANAR